MQQIVMNLPLQPQIFEQCKFMIIMKTCVGEQTYYSKGISFKHSFFLQIR